MDPEVPNAKRDLPKKRSPARRSGVSKTVKPRIRPAGAASDHDEYPVGDDERRAADPDSPLSRPAIERPRAAPGERLSPPRATSTNQAAGTEFAASYEEAKRRYSRGDVAGARDLLQRLVAGAPTNARYQLALAVACSDLGDSAAAERAFRAVLEQEPRNEQAVLQLGRLLEGLGRAGDAQPLYARLRYSSVEANRRYSYSALASENTTRLQEHQPRYSPAEVGVVKHLERRSELDTSQPSLASYNRATSQVVTFGLLLDDGRVSAVEMRGSTLVGVLHEGDRVAIPSSRDQHGVYRVDRVHRLQANDEAIMQPLVLANANGGLWAVGVTLALGVVVALVIVIIANVFN